MRFMALFLVVAVSVMQTGWSAAASESSTIRINFQATGNEPPHVVQPVLETVPNADDLASLFPLAALRSMADGLVTLKCMVQLSHKLTDCVILDETPQNLGFGSAALKSADLFRATPKIVNGIPELAPMKFRMRFRYPVVQAPELAADEAIYNFYVRWLKRPSPDQIKAAKPKETNGISAGVSMICEITEAGLMSNCQIQSEEPEGLGFGAAALSLVPLFQARQPPKKDVEGPLTASIPLYFAP